MTGMPLQKAYEYFDNVLEHKQAIPFRRFNGGVGRTPQVNYLGTTQGRCCLLYTSDAADE